eukprot:12435-Heterococcus_DN1.PRE.2
MHRSTTVLLTVVLTATTCTVLYTTLTLQAGALRPEVSSCSSEHSEQEFAGSLSAGGSSVMSAADQSRCLPYIKPLTKAAAAKAAARKAAGLTRLQCCHSPIKGRDNAWTLLDRPTRRTSSAQATSSATAIAAKGNSTATRPRVNSSVALSIGSSSRRNSAG